MGKFQVYECESCGRRVSFGARGWFHTNVPGQVNATSMRCVKPVVKQKRREDDNKKDSLKV